MKKVMIFILCLFLLIGSLWVGSGCGEECDSSCIAPKCSSAGQLCDGGRCVDVPATPCESGYACCESTGQCVIEEDLINLGCSTCSSGCPVIQATCSSSGQTCSSGKCITVPPIPCGPCEMCGTDGTCKYSCSGYEECINNECVLV